MIFSMAKPKYFVFDTNSLLSAALIQASVNARALDKAFKTGQLIMSHETLLEVTEVLYRPKFDRYLTNERRVNIIERLEQDALFFAANQQVHVCRDPKDDKFLELALTVKASCIVTGDKDLLILDPFRGIPIITASKFLDLSFV